VDGDALTFSIVSPPQHGHRVFSEMQGAEQKLQHLLNQQPPANLPPAAYAAAMEAILDILHCTRQLAEQLLIENQDLRAVNPKFQKQVDRQLEITVVPQKMTKKVELTD